MANFLVIDFLGTLINSHDLYTTLMLERNETPEPMNSFASLPDILDSTQQMSKSAFLKQLQRFINEKPLAFSPFDDLLETLTILRRADFQFALLAPRLANQAQDFCDEFALDLFEFIESDTGMFSKSINFQRMLQKHGLEAHNVFYLSGQVKHLHAATAQSIRTIACPWGFDTASDLQNTIPTYTIIRPNELLTVLTEQLVA